MKTTIILLRYDFNHELYQLTQNAMATLKADEKILVDNGSSESLDGWADITIKNDTNLGYCKAVNQGFEKATGEAIAVANNDIRVSPNWIHVAKEILSEHPKVGSVHFKMIPYDEPFNLGYDTWIKGKERWCHSSFYVIRREAIPEGGYFEGYGEGGYDDWDFWKRFRTNGWKQAYTNRAQFQHRDSSTYNALNKRDGNRAERDLKNRELYKERFGGYPEEQFAEEFPDQMVIPWKPFP